MNASPGCIAYIIDQSDHLIGFFDLVTASILVGAAMISVGGEVLLHLTDLRYNRAEESGKRGKAYGVEFPSAAYFL